MTLPQTVNDECSPVGVGLIGWSDTSRFLCERLSLRSDLRLVAVHVDSYSGPVPLELSGVESAHCLRFMTPHDVFKAPEPDVLWFAAGSPLGWMIDALARRKSVILEAPHELSVAQLERLARAAEAGELAAAIYQPRRWEPDFLAARSALQSGRIGRLLRLRCFVHEQRLPDETYPLGVATELGFAVLDQMLQLTQANKTDESTIVSPQTFPARTTPFQVDPSEGFVANIELAEDVSAIIEIQTRSLLGFRSGWMIEGTDGAYRHGRLYTRTADGEIVDEPWPPPPVSSDPFLDALTAALRGHTNDLPTARESVRVAALLHDADSCPLAPALP